MKESDILIIGAGIVGVNIANELTFQKDLSIHVIDAYTISSQTSRASSKMLHGGIRYLENMDFMLVHEALKEKNYWLKQKPHLAKQAPFYLPIYKESKYPLWMMKIGVFIYNLLSGFKNKSYKSLNQEEFSNLFPMIKTQNLRGAAGYSDAIIDDEKFCIEIANDAKKNGALFFENQKAHKIEQYDDSYLIHTENEVFKTKKLIIAAGPFTDQVAKLIEPNWRDIILASKGVHLWIKKESLPIKGNMVLQTKDNRIIFIIDHKEKILIGTTETVEKEASFNINATEEDIDYILNNVNEYIKDKNLTRKDIISSFAGIRPLVKDSHSSSNKTSRHHKIFTPKENLYIIAGGKYTTCRVMAKDLIAKIYTQVP